jgi:hypothetical protein
MSDADAQAQFDKILADLKTVQESLDQSGKAAYNGGAPLAAGLIGAALLIVEEVIGLMEHPSLEKGRGLS